MKNKKDKDNTQFDPYSTDKLSKIKPGVKIGFLKFWAAGALFFFVFSGLSLGFDFWDRIIIMALVMILFNEFIVFKIIIWMNNDNQYTLKYLPHHFKRERVASISVTAAYVIVMLVLSVLTAEGIMELLVNRLKWLQTRAIEPISFGLIFLWWDFVWVSIKNLIFPQYKTPEKS